MPVQHRNPGGAGGAQREFPQAASATASSQPTGSQRVNILEDLGTSAASVTPPRHEQASQRPDTLPAQDVAEEDAHALGGPQGRMASPPAWDLPRAAPIAKDKLPPIEYGSLINSGAFGMVHESTWRGYSVAVKIFAAREAHRQDKAAYTFDRELDALLGMPRHPNVVPLLAYCSAARALVFPMLQSLQADSLPTAERLHISADIARGVAFLHAQRPVRVHRDIKPDNVLLREAAGRRIGVVADLGALRAAEETATGICTPMFVNAQDLFDIKSGARPNTAHDVYALALTQLCILHGVRHVSQSGPLSMLESSGAPAGITAMLRRMLSDKAQARPSATAALTEFESGATSLLVGAAAVAVQPYSAETGVYDDGSAGDVDEFTRARDAVRLIQLMNAEEHDINGRCPISEALVHSLFAAGPAEAIRALERLCVVSEVRNRCGWTLLHFCAASDTVEGCRALVQLGADLEARDFRRQTPLHAVAMFGSDECCRALVELGADLEARDETGYTPLQAAAMGDASAVFCTLLELGAVLWESDDSGWTPLHDAAVYGSVIIIGKLVELGADLEARDETGCTPLRLAARSTVESLRPLVELGADREARDFKGWTPLHGAAATPDSDERCRTLVELGADLEARDNEGRTPLHLAAEIGSVEVSSTLVQLGADPAARDEKGWTPLHVAAAGNSYEACRALVELGADLEAQDDDLRTPLKLAAEFGQDQTFRILKGLGADPIGRTI